MRTSERVLIYAGLLAAIALALGWKGLDRTAEASIETDELRIATVDILAIVQDKLNTEKYEPAREAEQERWVQRRDELFERLQDIQRQTEVLAEGDPELNQLVQQYQQAERELRQVVQQASEAIDRFTAQQISEAYRTVKDAALEVSRGEGYTHVFASRQREIDDEPEGTTEAMQEILARPILVAADADDLTDRVRDSLDMND